MSVSPEGHKSITVCVVVHGNKLVARVASYFFVMIDCWRVKAQFLCLGGYKASRLAIRACEDLETCQGHGLVCTVDDVINLLDATGTHVVEFAHIG